MPSITLFYAGVFGILMALLSIRVPIRRAKLDASWGDAGDRILATRIRVFGNFIEYIPFMILLMALVEIGGICPRQLHAAAITLLFVRLAHAFSLMEGELPLWRKIGRGVGAMGTWLVLMFLSVQGLLMAIEVGVLK
ncbi:MAG: MAPEG family protein [Parasphingorhabdus sp.]